MRNARFKNRLILLLLLAASCNSSRRHESKLSDSENNSYLSMSMADILASQGESLLVELSEKSINNGDRDLPSHTETDGKSTHIDFFEHDISISGTPREIGSITIQASERRGFRDGSDPIARKEKRVSYKENETERLKADIAQDKTAIKEISQKNADQAAAAQASLSGVMEEAIAQHNQKIQTLTASSQELSEQVHGPQPEFQTPRDSVPGAKLYHAQAYRNLVAIEVAKDTSATRTTREKFIEFADTSIVLADEAYHGLGEDLGDFYVNLSLRMLDVALTFTPGIGFGYDLYQIAMGKDVTGTILSTFDRSFIAATIFVPTLAAKPLRKLASTLGRLSKKGIKGTEELAGIFKNVDEVEAVFESARKGEWSKVIGRGLRPGSLADEGMSNLRNKFRHDKGIPRDWGFEKSKDPDGISFFKPGTLKADEIRVMPGKPSNPYPNSQQSYVTWKRDGKWLDKGGTPLPDNRRPEAHILLDEFKYKD